MQACSRRIAHGVIVTSGNDDKIGCDSSGIVPRDALYGGRTGNTSIYQSVKEKRFSIRIHYYDIQYCAKRMQTNLDEIRLLFSRNFAEILGEEV